MARKININRQEMSSAEIKAGQNFKQLLSRPQAVSKPLYQTKWFATGIAAIALSTMLVVGYWQWQAGINRGVNQQVLAENFVNPPIAGVDIPYEIYSVNTNKARVITTQNGTRIFIPANAFVRSDGKTAGKVELKYREFHDPVDFFVSGIPMTYDSAGQEYTFESAGMFEMRAYEQVMSEKKAAKRDELMLSPGKEIEVELFSKVKVGNFNVYYLDEQQKNWANKGVDSIVNVESHGIVSEAAEIVSDNRNFDTSLLEIDSYSADFDGELAEPITPKLIEPVKPKVSDPDNYTFDLDVNDAEFPEIAGYKGMLFEVDPSESKFTAGIYEIVWDDITLKSSDIKGKYRMVLRQDKAELEFLVYPVLEGDNYEAALATYEAKFKTYETKLSKRKAEDAERERKYKIALAKQKADAIERQAAMKNREANLNVSTASIKEINRYLAVDRMGYWNCDRPYPFPKGGQFMAKLVDDNNKQIEISQLKLVDRDRNMIFTYFNNLQTNTINVNYSPAANNIMFGLDIYGRLAVIRSDKLKRLKPQGDVTLQVELIEEKLTTAAEIKKYLGI